MPHLTIEYSKSLITEQKLATLLSDLHAGLGACESVDIESVRTRAYGTEVFHVGTKGRGFLHGTLLLLPGRSAPIKQAIREKLLGILSKWQDGAPLCSISLEIREMDKETYSTRNN